MRCYVVALSAGFAVGFGVRLLERKLAYEAQDERDWPGA